MSSHLKLKDEYISLTKNERLHSCHKPIVALTGGIATGKSTASRLLGESGLVVIDADQLVKSIYAQKSTQEALKSVAPKEAFKSDGSIDFPSLRRWAFEHPDNRENLEKLIYPQLPEAFRSQVRNFPREEVFIYDVPLLFEKNLHKGVDLSVCVYAPRAMQVERLVKRDSISPQEAKAILNEQMDIDEKVKLSDVTLINKGEQEDLATDIEAFITTYFESLSQKN